MKKTLWIYPWDILDASPDAVMQEIRELGITHLSLASSYHAGRLLLPHNPRRRVFQLEDGTVYFQPRFQGYRGTPLRPKRSALYGRVDPLKQICRQAQEHDLGIHAWTVLLHNSRLGEAHPRYVLKNVFGEGYPFALCPSHEVVRHFAACLVADLGKNYPLKAIELESAGFMSYEHRWHHDKTGLPIDTFHNFLLSVCFCSACRLRMQEEGLDVEWLRHNFLGTLQRFFESADAVPGDSPELALERLSELLGNDQMQALLHMRDNTVKSLIQQLRAEVPPEIQLIVTSASSPLLAGSSPGASLQTLAEVSDGLLLSLTGTEFPSAELNHFLAADSKAVSRYVGFRIHWPDVRSEIELGERVAYLSKAPIQGIHFYNYGLASRQHLKWLGKALATM